MAPLRLLSLKERWGWSWKGLESLPEASGVNGLEAKGGAGKPGLCRCPFPNGSIFAEKTWNRSTSSPCTGVH